MVSFNRGRFNLGGFNQFAEAIIQETATVDVTATLTAVPSRSIDDSAAFTISPEFAAVPSRHTLGIAAFDIAVTLAAVDTRSIDDSAAFTTVPEFAAEPSRSINDSATFDVTVLFNAYASPHIFDGVLLGTVESAELVQTIEADEIAPVLLVVVQPLTIAASSMSLVLEASELTQTAEVL
jgi:hypothetical protein